MDYVHESKVGTYHPPDGACPAWTVNDARGYLDGGPPCDECGRCECESECPGEECIGLSFGFSCLDGGDFLCTDYAKGIVEIIPCDCK